MLALLVLGALWGGSFLFIRVAAHDLGPFLLVELRVGIAAAALTVFAFAARRVPKTRGLWGRMAVLGLFNAAVPFSLISAAELHLTASLAAILNSTTVLFTVFVAAAWIGSPLTRRKLLGVALGTVGVAVLVGWDPLPLSLPVLLSVAAMLGASLSYAVGAVYTKRALAGAPPMALAIGQQTVAAALMLPLAAATLPGEPPSPTVVAAVLALALLCTAVAYLLYFYLIENAGPTATSTVTLVVPVFGLIFGVVLLGEPVGIGTIIGLLTVLLSVSLVVGVRLRPAKA